MKREIQTMILTMWMAIWIMGSAFGQSRQSTDTRNVGKWPFPQELNGTMMAYDFGNTDTIVPWGEEMHPVLVSYVARHGARFLSSEKKIDKLRKELTKATQEGNISSLGKDFLGVIEMVDSATAGNWGALNQTGIIEEKTLGRQMYTAAPNLLGNGKAEAKATYVPRVVMTMYEVCHELARLTPDIRVTTSEGSQFDSLLRYFKTDTAYVRYMESGPWIEAYDRYADSITPCSPAAKLFVTPPDDHKLRKLTMDMYGILQSLQASGLYAPADEWFSEKEFESCWKVDNLKHYYQRSVSGYSDLPARAATPLLTYIINTIDATLSGRSHLQASLLFGHAETVIPLFALMRLPDCYAPECTPNEVSSEWKDYDIAPLGANLLIVVLRDSAGEPYAAMRLNGQWITFSGEKTTAWDKLKSLWLSYISGRSN